MEELNQLGMQEHEFLMRQMVEEILRASSISGKRQPGLKLPVRL